MEDKKLPAQKEISKMCTVARTVAMLTVISAHLTIRTSEVVSNLYQTIGSIGVVVFLLISGYYYEKTPLVNMVPKKIKTVVLPWLLLGSLVWVVDSLLNGRSLNVLSWIQWLMGYKTYLYFVVVLLVCFVLFYIRNSVTLWIAVALNVVSIALTACGVPFVKQILDSLHLTNYLNVFNWVGFFALGILAQSLDAEKILAFLKKTRLLALGFSSIATAVIAFTDVEVGYFSALGWLYELLCAWSIFDLCTFDFAYNKVTVSISETSYAIYLIHLMFTGILAKIYGFNAVLSLFANVIVLSFTWGLLILGEVLANKCRLGDVYRLLLGIRRRK